MFSMKTSNSSLYLIKPIVVDVFGQLMHAAGVIHCDLASRNCLIDSASGVVKIGSV